MLFEVSRGERDTSIHQGFTVTWFLMLIKLVNALPALDVLFLAKAAAPSFSLGLKKKKKLT